MKDTTMNRPSFYRDGGTPTVIRLDAKDSPLVASVRERLRKAGVAGAETMDENGLACALAGYEANGTALPDAEALPGPPAPGAQGPNAFDDRFAPRGPVDAYDVARELFAASARPTRADADEIPDEENVAKAIARRNHRDANAWRHPVGVQRGPISAESAGAARTDAGHIRTQEQALEERRIADANAWRKPIGASR